MQGTLDTFRLDNYNIYGPSSGLPNMLDYSAYTTVYDWSGTVSSIGATAWGIFIDETGEGYLTFCRGFCTHANGDNPNIKITIDGILSEFNNSTNTGGSYQGNIIHTPIYFKKSLKIEMYNRDATSRNFGCDYTYLLRQTVPSLNQTILTATTKDMKYLSTVSTTFVDLINISNSGYLLAAELEGCPGTLNFNLSIDGVTKTTDRQVYLASNTTIKQPVFIGPIRYNTSTIMQIKSPINQSIIGRAWYTID